MTEPNENQQIGSQQNYVTVIPVEYTRTRNYNAPVPDYVVEQFRTHDDYIQAESLSSSQGALYSVSQRVPTVSNSYGSLCPNTSEQSGYSSLPNEWGCERTPASLDDKEAETLSDKKIGDKATPVPLTTVAAIGTSTLPDGNVQGSSTSLCLYLHNRLAVLMEIEDVQFATNETLCRALVNSDEFNFNKPLALQVFTLWMTSPLLELQLKPTHRPFQIRQNWKHILEQYSHTSYNHQLCDEPILSFQRNVFLPLHIEEKIKDPKIVELLYEEAKHNILMGRYPCELSHYIMLGGIQARIDLGPYNTQVHTIHYFREEQSKYLPVHIRKSTTWAWLPISSKASAEVRLLEQFKRIPNSATNRKLIRKYLEFCWTLPFYGAAFFEGQIEQPVRGLMSLLTHQDIPVLIAINSKGIYVIDIVECTVLLGLHYEELSWDYAKPSKEDDPNCLPCLFLQFMVMENGAHVSKILQIFSQQASFMDSLISTFIQQQKRKSTNDEPDRSLEQMSTESETHASLSLNVHSSINLPSLSNKLNKLTLATFDEDGRLIGQMGSWSFSYQ